MWYFIKSLGEVNGNYIDAVLEINITKMKVDWLNTSASSEAML